MPPLLLLSSLLATALAAAVFLSYVRAYTADTRNLGGLSRSEAALLPTKRSRSRTRRAAARQTSSSWSYLPAYSYEATAGAPSNADENGSVLLYNYGNDTTCFLSSFEEEWNGSSGSTGPPPLPSVTGVVPGCGGADGATFLALHLIPGHEEAGGGVRNESGVFGGVRSIYGGANYSLDLVVQLSVQEVLFAAANPSLGADDDGDGSLVNDPGSLASYDLPGGVAVGYVRLVFCDALQMGACDAVATSRTKDSPSPLLTTDYTNYLEENDIGSDSSNGVPSPRQNQSYSGGADATYLPLAGNGYGGVMTSPWLAVTLLPPFPSSEATTNGTYRAQHLYTVSLPGNVTSGAFFVLGHARFNFVYTVAAPNSSALNGTGTTPTTVQQSVVTRLDMTRALSSAAAVVASPPFIQTTTQAIKIYLIVVSVVCGAFAMMCFASILYHRRHPVMTLSQGSFLAALVAACFVQIVFVFTYLPTEDIYCTLSGPLELIPMHAGGSILVARVWRAYSALGVAALIGRHGDNSSPPSSSSSPLSRSSRRTFELLERWHLGKKYIQCLSWLARLPLRCLGRQDRDPMRHTIRQKVTAAETASLAAMLSLPQVLVQVFGAAYYRRGLELQLDPSGSVGRYICQSYGRWVDQAGIGLVGLVYIGAVAAAWIARLLPSVFNEKNQVFHASFVNCLIAFITLPLLELTNDPTDSPDVQVFLRSLLSIGIAMTVIIVMILPKLRRVWSGEKVVLTNVLEARFKAGSTPAAGDSRGNHEGKTAAADERIKLKEGDPLPYPIEQQVLRLHDVLRTVEDRCCEGRPLSRDEWSRLREYTHALDSQLVRIDIAYNHETDEESPTN